MFYNNITYLLNVARYFAIGSLLKRKIQFDLKNWEPINSVIQK